MKEGIESGAYYYLTKPYDYDLMMSIVAAGVRDYAERRRLVEELHRFKSKLKIIRDCCFEIRTLEEARYLTTFISQLFPNPESVSLGVSELLINAVEHGNLEVTYEEKSELLAAGNWESEIQRRTEDERYRDRTVEVQFAKAADSVSLIITDQGDGFDAERYMDFDPGRATHSHGRGVAMAKKVSFDDLEYRGKGNQVVCKVYLKSDQP